MMECSHTERNHSKCECECRHILRWMQRANQLGFNQINNSIFSYRQLIETFERTASYRSFSEVISQHFSKIKAVNFCKNYINCKCCERHKKNRLKMNEIFYKEHDYMET